MAMLKRRSSSLSMHKTDKSNITDANSIWEFAERSQIQTEPLDVERLAIALGIEVRFETMPPDISGSLENIDGSYVIKSNSLHHPNRQRFTIAHEIGHYILHRKKKSSFLDEVFFRDDTRSPMEAEANRFAADILMPEHRFRTFVRSSSSKVEDLADNFGVSPLAVRYRAKQLGFSGHGV